MSIGLLCWLQTVYKIKWAGTEERTWEPFSNLGLAGDSGKQLFLDWLVKSKQFAELQEAVDSYVASEQASESSMDVEYSGPMPALDDATQQQTEQQQRQQQMSSLSADSLKQGKGGPGSSSSSGGNTGSLCTKYSEGRFDGKTCGVFQSFDGGCGYPSAPMEMRGECLPRHALVSRTCMQHLCQ